MVIMGQGIPQQFHCLHPLDCCLNLLYQSAQGFPAYVFFFL